MARLISIVIMAIALMCALAEKELYDDKFDDIDVQAILQNDKLREQYLKCFMEEGPCVTADAKFFKEFASEALVTKCERCTEKQKGVLEAIVSWFTENNPDKWQIIVAKSLEDMKKKNG